ncbi:MAG: hypothetical protein IH977_14755 [Nitrospinae bacterium]|nr:hypothetical protein [Nitrospinota bacterium]
MSIEEFQRLLTDQERIQLIAKHTSLDPACVTRIEKLGQPWPLGLPKGLGLEGVAEGINPIKALASFNLLLDMGLKDPDSELGNPDVEKHIQKVVTLSGEDEETIRSVHDGTIAHQARLTELVKEEVERKGRESDQK